MRRSLALLAVSVAALVAAVGPRVAGDGDGRRDAGTAGPGRTLHGRVERVVDGDTIRVALGGRVERVRYIGIDTPESVKPGTPVQCFAHLASRANATLVGGRRVRLVLDVEPRDRYGRLLAYVYRDADGLFVNAALVRDGFARTLTIPPNVRFAGRFARLATEARHGGRGLWSACASA